MTSQSLICKYLIWMWYIDYNYILSVPTSLNKYLKNIKLLKVLSLSLSLSIYYNFSINFYFGRYVVLQTPEKLY